MATSSRIRRGKPSCACAVAKQSTRRETIPQKQRSHSRRDNPFLLPLLPRERTQPVCLLPRPPSCTCPVSAEGWRPMLMACGLCICTFIYSLVFICDSKTHCSHSRTRAEGINLSHRYSCSQVDPGDTLPSGFSSHYKRSPFQSTECLVFSIFFFFFAFCQ